VANVLLVDDDAENLWALRIALEGDGHRVIVAGDARRAMGVLSREHVQLMVTDLEMPEMNGAQLCLWVRSQPAHGELPIVMLSAAPEPAGCPRCWTRFLRKPADLGDLSRVIHAHVAARLTGRRRSLCKVCAYAALKCQDPSASRWPAVNADCWP
jgi:CheY-like chemotaxis protein